MELQPNDIIRFESKVVKTEISGACWTWKAALNKEGYGQFSIKYANYGAHVVAYFMAKGPVPEGLQIDHTCRNRGCVNPDHMEPVTIAVNVMRGDGPPAKNKRKTHCPKGHPYDDKNTFVRKSGRRRCKTCASEAFKKWWSKNKSKAA